MFRPRSDRRKTPWSALLGLGLLASSAFGSDPRPISDAPLRGPLHSLATGRFTGAGSCAASKCHNSRHGSDALPGSEHAIWATRDRHSTAYTVLLGERSRRIERNYRPDRPLRAERDALCLNCHSHMQFEASSHDRQYDMADGVGCESCHGAAGNWIAGHTEAGWRTLSPTQKASYGFFPTDDLVSRVRMCAECHVGSTRRTSAGELVEVNHDLIAAGHPRLTFDYAAYLGIGAKHWLTADERAKTPDLEARTYSVGQVAALQAALDLLAERAKAAEASPKPSIRSRAWPELAESSCYACHHDLDDPSASQARGYAYRRPGSLPWNSWQTPAINVLNDATGEPGPSAIQPLLAEIGDLMSSPYPEPNEAASLAAEAADALEPWLHRLRTQPLGPDRQRQIASGLVNQGLEKGQDWDAAAQTFLGLAAMHQALGESAPGLRDPALRDPISRIVPALKFGPRLDSPGPARLGDPIKAELEWIGDILRRTAEGGGE